MSTQPEALRLAAALDELLGYRGINADVGKAADELRRLHLVNTELLEALKICEKCLRILGYAFAADIADAAIANATKE